ncbi:unnamed protein product [Amoebophrya sp. A120]|nr:unnamed protein product [Amoebophrya sp. A120]|eukprot:GSA120T00017853001.1
MLLKQVALLAAARIVGIVFPFRRHNCSSGLVVPRTRCRRRRKTSKLQQGEPPSSSSTTVSFAPPRWWFATTFGMIMGSVVKKLKF